MEHGVAADEAEQAVLHRQAAGEGLLEDEAERGEEGCSTLVEADILDHEMVVVAVSCSNVAGVEGRDTAVDSAAGGTGPGEGTAGAAGDNTAVAGSGIGAADMGIPDSGVLSPAKSCCPGHCEAY